MRRWSAAAAIRVVVRCLRVGGRVIALMRSRGRGTGWVGLAIVWRVRVVSPVSAASEGRTRWARGSAVWRVLVVWGVRVHFGGCHRR